MSKKFNPEGESVCVWKPLPDKRWQCKVCGTVRVRRPVRICQSESEQARLRQESQAKKRAARALAAKQRGVASVAGSNIPNHWWPVLFTRWLTAMARWLWESYNARRWLIRSEAEYRRVRRICESCPEWNAKKEECKVCGCGGRSKVVLLNKLKIETEKCPQGKWYPAAGAKPS